MVGFVKDVLGCWPMNHHKLMSNALYMKWRCRGRLVEFKLCLDGVDVRCSSFEVHTP